MDYWPVWAPLRRSPEPPRSAFITQHPKLDGTDFYMFNSYETGRQGFVTLIADYLPLQDAYGGPNYFTLDPKARYDINIDNDGDAKIDIRFRFNFQNTLNDIALDIAGKQISVPFVNIGPTTVGNTANLNVVETYTVEHWRNGKVQQVTDAKTRVRASPSPPTTSATSLSPTTPPTPIAISTTSKFPAAPPTAACSSASAKIRL